MKTWVYILLGLLLSSSLFAFPKQGRGYYNARYVKHGNDTILSVDLLPITVFRRKADLRRYYKMIYNLKKVYPVAKFARERLAETNAKLAEATTKQEERQIIKALEKELIKEYTPILKKMTFSQGAILLKLIDRETGNTSYELLKQLRGSLSAWFWNGVAKLFSANLKATYDAEGEDKLLEQLIIYYEAGLL